MDPQRSLHLSRLREAMTAISTWRSGRTNAWSPEFRAWQDRTGQSLSAIFGPKHQYVRRWTHLDFCLARVTIGSASPSWSSADQESFVKDLIQAEAILKDALEEAQLSSVASAALAQQPRPGVVVNVLNVLSQTTSVSLEQVLAQLDHIALSDAERSEAERHVRDIAVEVQGAQRWPVLAKSLDALKALGKGAYERVALPLILELVKKQAGL